jgi:hypothetical protein
MLFLEAMNYSMLKRMVAAGRVALFTECHGTVQSYDAEFTQVSLYMKVLYSLPTTVMGQEVRLG